MEATITKEARDLMSMRVHQIDQEKGRLERALAELGSNGNGPRRPGRPKGPAKPRNKRRGGTRIDQAMKLIAENPGITAGEIAKRMKIKPNYLYRVLGELSKAGQVKKSGRQFHPAS